MLNRKGVFFLLVVAMVSFFILTSSSFAAGTEKSYFGKWRFEQIRFESNVSAGTDGVNAEYKNSTMICNDNEYVHKSINVRSPQYVEERYSKEQFSSEYRINMNLLGDRNGQMINVKVMKNGVEQDDFWYMTDKNEVLKSADGVFIGSKRL